MSRVYPVSEDVLTAILQCIDGGLYIQREIAEEASRLLDRTIGERTVWEGIRRLVAREMLVKKKGRNGDQRYLSFTILDQGFRRLGWNVGEPEARAGGNQ